MKTQTLNVSTAQQPAQVSLTRQNTSNIEEHAGGLRGWSLQYHQLEAGRFVGELAILDLDGLQLVRDRANLAMIKSGAARTGSVSFSFPLSSHDDSFHCAGRALTLPSLLAAPASHLPEMRTPGGLELLCLTVDETHLSALSDAPDDCRWHVAPCCYPLDERDNRATWRVLAATLLDERQHTASLLAFPAIQQGLRDTLLIYLSEMIDNKSSITLDGSTRKRIVDRACDFMLARRDNPPSILELCRQIGTSRRKLQYCFQETLGVSPVSYLRTLRLNGVHRDLLAGSVTVQEAAAHWGFWHLSRLAGDYRQLFGETPSTTLQRRRGEFC